MLGFIFHYGMSNVTVPLIPQCDTSQHFLTKLSCIISQNANKLLSYCDSDQEVTKDEHVRKKTLKL